MQLASLPATLPHSETLELIQRAQRDPNPRVRRRARDRVVAANLRLVFHVAKRYRGRGLDLEDLIGEGSLGLLVAVDRFDCARGLRFSTYATWWIRHAVSRAVADKGRVVRVPVHALAKRAQARRAGESDAGDGLSLEYGLSLDAPIGDGVEGRGWHDVTSSPGASPEELVLFATEHALARELVEELGGERRAIVEARYGLDGSDEKTLRDVGATLRATPISRERVRQLEQEAMQELRALVA